MQVDFYHLTGAPVERIVPRIAERVVEAGGRLLIVADDEGLASRLDTHLWNYRPDSFLPHGRTGAGDEQLQPILISANCDALNGARNIALADGVWRDEALGADRVFFMFGDARIMEARATWRLLADREGVERRFWKQDEEGRWTQQA